MKRPIARQCIVCRSRRGAITCFRINRRIVVYAHKDCVVKLRKGAVAIVWPKDK
jgi:hypothetical protein